MNTFLLKCAQNLPVKTVPRELSVFPVNYIVRGPPFAGKTAYLRELARRHGAVYIDLLYAAFYNMYVDDLVAYIIQNSQNKRVVLDHYDSYNNVSSLIHSLLVHDYSVLLSERAQRVFVPFPHVIFLPYSFREYAAATHTAPSPSLLQKYLWEGGFPEIVHNITPRDIFLEKIATFAGNDLQKAPVKTLEKLYIIFPCARMYFACDPIFAGICDTADAETIAVYTHILRRVKKPSLISCFTAQNDIVFQIPSRSCAVAFTENTEKIIKILKKQNFQNKIIVMRKYEPYEESHHDIRICSLYSFLATEILP